MKIELTEDKIAINISEEESKVFIWMIVVFSANQAFGKAVQTGDFVEGFRNVLNNNFKLVIEKAKDIVKDPSYLKEVFKLNDDNVFKADVNELQNFNMEQIINSLALLIVSILNYYQSNNIKMETADEVIEPIRNSLLKAAEIFMNGDEDNENIKNNTKSD